jgi:hypothetical protein
MHEPTTGARRSLDRPVHRACVVTGCWCREAARSATRPTAARPVRAPSADRAIDLTAWRSVGLPVA